MSPRIGLDLPTLLQAAAEIADTQGINEVTLASLAKKLEIRSPSLYNHIDGLNGLRKKLAIHGLQQLYSVLSQSTIGRSGDEAILALAESYVSFARIHPGLYEATLRAPHPQDTEVQQIGSDIVNLVLQMLRAYDLEDETALHVVRGLRSILHGFTSLEQNGGFGLPLDLDVTLHLLINTFLAGLHQMKTANGKSD